MAVAVTSWLRTSIQFTVSETVGVEGRGGYYDGTGVLRDMIQNHMFQMLAYVCMEPPSSFKATAVRNEKGKLLDAVRLYKAADVPLHCARGQYGPVERDGKLGANRLPAKYATPTTTELTAKVQSGTNFFTFELTK